MVVLLGIDSDDDQSGRSVCRQPEGRMLLSRNAREQSSEQGGRPAASMFGYLDGLMHIIVHW